MSNSVQIINYRLLNFQSLTRFLLPIILFLGSLKAFGQITITYSVDISNYLASGAYVGPNGIRIGGNFATLNTNLPEWQPSAEQCAMQNLANNLWTISVSYPNSAIGSAQLFKFVNNDWGANEMMDGNNIGCFDESTQNRIFIIPNSDTSICFLWNECTTCTGPINCKSVTNSILQSAIIPTYTSDSCTSVKLDCKPSVFAYNWSYQWMKNGIIIPGANQSSYLAPPSQNNGIYSCTINCPETNLSVQSNSFAKEACFNDVSSQINYLLVQNVSTNGNNSTNKTIQVQFDLSWGNTWWDDINWDAAWVFMKYKTAAGEWKHAKINPTGFDKGQGSPSIIQPTADKLGAFIRLGLKGQGNFNAEGMQLQWNYGLDGLNSVNGLEVKVFAIEMVYQPQGDFSLFGDGSYGFYPEYVTAPGGNVALVNSRLSPVLSLYLENSGNLSNFRIKGDAGIDLNADGAIDNTTFPTGYNSFYIFKYEMSEQAYADFLNCLSPAQVTTVGIAGTSITQNQGQYFAAAPNRACKSATNQNLLAYADWSGLRPLSYFELNKAWNGPNPPNFDDGYCCGGNPADASGNRGKGYYGAKDLRGNVLEPFAGLQSTSFSGLNGDGILAIDGSSNQSAWLNLDIIWGEFILNDNFGQGFRLCRSAE
jgi:hypothetical protein